MNTKATVQKPKLSNPLKGKTYFFGIGIDDYEYENNLYNAVKDVERISGILSKVYNIDEIRCLKNRKATRKSIYKNFIYYQDRIKENDNLIIYYAGHGTIDEDGEGYWIPSLAKDIDDYVSNDDVIKRIRKIKAKHIFLIIDSCFSGSFLNTDYNNRTSNKSIDTLYNFGSRYLLCSSLNNQLSSDGKLGEHSPFAKSIIGVLEENREEFGLNILKFIDEVQKKFLNTNEDKDSSNQNESLKNQRPDFGVIVDKNHKGGQFVFFLQKHAKDWYEIEKMSNSDRVDSSTYLSFKSQYNKKNTVFYNQAEEKYWHALDYEAKTSAIAKNNYSSLNEYLNNKNLLYKQYIREVNQKLEQLTKSDNIYWNNAKKEIENALIKYTKEFEEGKYLQNAKQMLNLIKHNVNIVANSSNEDELNNTKNKLDNNKHRIVSQLQNSNDEIKINQNRVILAKEEVSTKEKLEVKVTESNSDKPLPSVINKSPVLESKFRARERKEDNIKKENNLTENRENKKVSPVSSYTKQKTDKKHKLFKNIPLLVTTSLFFIIALIFGMGKLIKEVDSSIDNNPNEDSIIESSLIPTTTPPAKIPTFSKKEDSIKNQDVKSTKVIANNSKTLDKIATPSHKTTTPSPSTKTIFPHKFKFNKDLLTSLFDEVNLYNDSLATVTHKGLNFKIDSRGIPILQENDLGYLIANSNTIYKVKKLEGTNTMVTLENLKEKADNVKSLNGNYFYTWSQARQGCKHIGMSLPSSTFFENLIENTSVEETKKMLNIKLVGAFPGDFIDGEGRRVDYWTDNNSKGQSAVVYRFHNNQKTWKGHNKTDKRFACRCVLSD